VEEETYTYYYPNPEGEVRQGPLQGEGRAWVPGEYRHPDYPSPLTVRVGEAGVKVWMLSQWLDLTHDDEAELQRRYGVHLRLTHRDIEAARWYREQYREMIDERIREESRAISG
jgi:hypothetical protein